MFKSHCLVSNPIRQDKLNPPPGLNVTFAIQLQPSPFPSGWCIEAIKPTQHHPKARTAAQFSQGNNVPIHLRPTQREQQGLIPMIGINRLAMIGRQSTGLSTVHPAIKVR